LEDKEMIMIATVLQVDSRSLLVRDSATGDEVLVLFSGANRFSVGDRVRISYSGEMTFSIPPQITAISIQRIQGAVPPPAPQPQPSPTEMRAVVLQRSRTSLLVRDNQSGRQVRVNYPYAFHFCVRQQIVVSYDTITLSNPPLVNATNITPVC